MKKTITIVVALFAIGTGFLLSWYLSSNRVIELEDTTWLGDQARGLSDFELVDQNGKTITRASLEGSWSLMFFGYTNCPDICPTTLSELNKVQSELDDKGEKIQVLMVTVDPERDTPPKLAEYVAHFHPDFVGLSGTKEEIDGAGEGFGIYYEKQEGSEATGYLVDHTARVFVVDPQGNYQLSFSYGTPVEDIVHDLFHMPKVMRQLAVAQFFSWFALFAMWIYGTAAVTSHHFGTSDTNSVAYNNGAHWVGVLFAAYNGFAALAAIGIPFVANRLGCRVSHMINVAIGGLSLISFFFISDPRLLLVPMIGVGIAWASILSLPYALLSSNLPSHKMGVYMGIFNFFIVIPQLVAASVLGLVIREFFGQESIFGLVTGGALMVVSGVAVLLVDKAAEPR